MIMSVNLCLNLSETEGGESCSLALNACQEIFDDILQIVGDINVSNLYVYDRT